MVGYEHKIKIRAKFERHSNPKCIGSMACPVRMGTAKHRQSKVCCSSRHKGWAGQIYLGHLKVAHTATETPFIRQGLPQTGFCCISPSHKKRKVHLPRSYLKTQYK